MPVGKRRTLVGSIVDGNGLSSATGIAVNALEEVAVVGDVVGNMGTAGAALALINSTSTPKYVVIAGLVLKHKNICIDLHGDLSVVHISDCVFVGDTAGAGRQGILIDPDTTGFTELVIEDCVFKDFNGTNSPIVGSGTPSLTLSNITIRNNRYFNCTTPYVSPGGITFDNTCWIEGLASPPSVASAATITLPPGPDVVTVTGTTTITSVAAGQTGRRVTLVFSGALTFTDGSNLKLAGNFVTTADDTISLVCDGTNWIETSRSVN